jgi:hypothetical protein
MPIRRASGALLATAIFTGQVSKDYRNMAVLSDMVSILAGHDDPDMLAVQGAARCGVTLPTFRRRGATAGSGEPA